jgi:IclR family mhp operon transcriptional activator
MAMPRGDARLHEDGRSYGNVMLVQRVLAVLQSANALPAITIKGISESCHIPRCSVVRIVETLCAEGFLVHLSRSAGYTLSSKVRSLSSGYHGAPEIVEVLRSHVDTLTRTHLWPFSIATLERDAMVVQYTSLPLSPLAHVRTTLHKRLSLLSRAHGLAYLSFCSSLERHRLVRMAAALGNPEDRVVADARSWRRHVVQVRQRGFAIRLSEADPFTQSIAVPIVLSPGHVAATLGATFFRRVLNNAQRTALAANLIAVADETAALLRVENCSIPQANREPMH